MLRNFRKGDIVTFTDRSVAVVHEDQHTEWVTVCSVYPHPGLIVERLQEQLQRPRQGRFI